MNVDRNQPLMVERRCTVSSVVLNRCVHPWTCESLPVLSTSLSPDLQTTPDRLTDPAPNGKVAACVFSRGL